jgi:hypothetical protein
LRLAAVRLAKRREVDHQAEIDRLMRQFGTLADRMREHGYDDEARMSPAELLVKHALEASDGGADPAAFWATLRTSVRAWLDANASTRASVDHIGADM